MIDYSVLQQKAQSWGATHPKFVEKVREFEPFYLSDNASLYAIAMGYNVIRSRMGLSTYLNVIDRKALVYSKSNYYD